MSAYDTGIRTCACARGCTCVHVTHASAWLQTEKGTSMLVLSSDSLRGTLQLCTCARVSLVPVPQMMGFDRSCMQPHCSTVAPSSPACPWDNALALCEKRSILLEIVRRRLHISEFRGRCSRSKQRTSHQNQVDATSTSTHAKLCSTLATVHMVLKRASTRRSAVCLWRLQRPATPMTASKHGSQTRGSPTR